MKMIYTACTLQVANCSMTQQSATFWKAIGYMLQKLILATVTNSIIINDYIRFMSLF